MNPHRMPTFAAVRLELGERPRQVTCSFQDQLLSPKLAAVRFRITSELPRTNSFGSA